MPGPRITLQGQRREVRRVAARLVQPEDGLRPWKAVSTTILPGGFRVENFAPVHLENGRPRRIVIELDDYCDCCPYAECCPGRGIEANARACADVEVSVLRRYIEQEASPLRFTYQPPAYGEEDLDYLT